MLLTRTVSLAALALITSLPALAQQTAPAQNDAATQMGSTSSYSALRDSLSNQSEVLTGDVTTQRAILKKNQELLKEAQRLDAANKKLLAEKQRMQQQNAELERQRAALAQNAAGSTAAQAQVAPRQQNGDLNMAKASTGEIK